MFLRQDKTPNGGPKGISAVNLDRNLKQFLLGETCTFYVK